MQIVIEIYLMMAEIWVLKSLDTIKLIHRILNTDIELF